MTNSFPKSAAKIRIPATGLISEVFELGGLWRRTIAVSLKTGTWLRFQNLLKAVSAAFRLYGLEIRIHQSWANALNFVFALHPSLCLAFSRIAAFVESARSP
jgi:hypothetical protein